MNNVLLDMLATNTDSERVDLTEGVSTYSYPEVNTTALTEETKNKFVNLISEHIVNRKFSPYYLINKILYTGIEISNYLISLNE